MSDDFRSFETLAVHAGAQPDPATGARITPIYQTAAYALPDIDEASALFAMQRPGYKYSRTANPTNAVLEARLAALEGGTAALATASGQSALFLSFAALMSPGADIVASSRLYGGTVALFGQSFPNFGWSAHFADPRDPASFEAAITPRTKALFVESLSNPDGEPCDLEALARIAHGRGLPLIVDNTLATPYLLRPLEHGADIVVHSTTKFLGGHGNALGGVLIDGGAFPWDERYPQLTAPSFSYPDLVLSRDFPGKALAMASRLFGMHDLGPTLSPFNAFLLLTGVETLALRMERHCENALAVARFLEAHPAVSWVRYSGLPSDPGHALAQRYAPKGGGSIFTFGLAAGYEACVRFVDGLRLFSHMANIGDTRSMAVHPASTTHKQTPDAQKIAAGVGPDTIRLSIGLEHKNDLIADLQSALSKA